MSGQDPVRNAVMALLQQMTVPTDDAAAELAYAAAGAFQYRIVPILNDGELDSKLTAELQIHRGAYFVWPRTTKGGRGVPLVRLREMRTPDLHIDVHVVQYARPKGADHATLYRLESPSSFGFQPDGEAHDPGSTDGHHEYFHAQFSSGLYASDDEARSFVRAPVNCVQPAFPLWAEGPVQLLLGLILALYGAETRGMVGNALSHPGVVAAIKAWPPRLQNYFAKR